MTSVLLNTTINNVNLNLEIRKLLLELNTCLSHRHDNHHVFKEKSFNRKHKTPNWGLQRTEEEKTRIARCRQGRNEKKFLQNNLVKENIRDKVLDMSNRLLFCFNQQSQENL